MPVAVAGRSDLALPALLLYLAAYAVTNLAAFAVVAALPGAPDPRRLPRPRPAPALARRRSAGQPARAGRHPADRGLRRQADHRDRRLGRRLRLAGRRRRSSTPSLSLFYYLRWLAPVVARTDPDAAGPAPRPFAEVAALLAAAASLLLGPMSGVLLGPLS